MQIIIFKSLRLISYLSLLALISACGGGGEFDPIYDENQPQDSKRRVNGELPFSSPSLMKMADSFRSASDYASAIRLYQRVAAESPRHLTSRLALGQIYQQLGSMDGASVYYQQVLDLQPENMDAQLGLGQVMVMSNRPLEAVGYLEQVAAKSPANFRIYNSIGLAYDLQGIHEKAQEAYGKGLNIMPDHISLLNNLALSLAIESEYAPAIQLLTKTVNIDYSQTTAQQNLIMVYAMSGEEDAARTMASSFMTKQEVEENILHYRWLKSLPSQKRAQAIFLNLKSFPDDEALPELDQVVQVENPTEAVITDEKKLMLMDILNEEEAPQEVIEVKKENAPQENTQLPADIDPEEMIPTAEIGELPSAQYKLQVGSYPTEEQLQTDWQRLNKLAPELLQAAKMSVQDVVTANGSTRYRLFVNEYSSFTAAQEFCSALSDNKVPCLVMNIEN